MKAYFASDQRQARLAYCAGLWLGTPFVPHGNLRGAGVDCVHLVEGIYLETGFFRNGVRFPGYSMDGGQHQEKSQLVTWLDESADFAPAQTVLPGDTLCFRLGRSAHHAGLALPSGRFIHCYYRRSVMVADLADHTWRRALAAIFRPMEED